MTQDDDDDDDDTETAATAEVAPPAGPPGDPGLDSVRIDKWLWAARAFKTRGLASEACSAGHVKVNGNSVKAAKTIRRGDEITIKTGDDLKIYEVLGLSERRGPAPVARTLYRDKSPPKPPTAQVPGTIVRDRGLGRPTKQERRDIRRLRGY